jgi:hypothetical protein
MGTRRAYSGRDNIATVDGVPCVDLSDADDAVSVSTAEDLFLDPDIDLNGEGAHVENTNQSGTITLKIKRTSIADLARFTALYQARAPIKTVACVDISTKAASAIGTDCRIARQPGYTRGKRSPDVEIMFKCIQIVITHDGPRITPV